MNHTLLGKIALLAFIVFLIGVIGSSTFGFSHWVWGYSIGEGQSISMTETVELGEAESAQVDLRMGAGVLTLSGGATALMEADLVYSESLEPQIDYGIDDHVGHLELNQVDSASSFLGIPIELTGSNTYSEWDLRFNNEVPLELRIDTGASQSTINLADVTLSGLNIHMGVGDATIDLSGEWQESFDVHLTAGVGQAKVILPEDVGVKLVADQGLGHLSTRGLYSTGSHQFINEAYESADVHIDIHVEMGVGNIEFVVE